MASLLRKSHSYYSAQFVIGNVKINAYPFLFLFFYFLVTQIVQIALTPYQYVECYLQDTFLNR